MYKPADASGAALSFRREKWLAGTSGVMNPFRPAAQRSSALRHPRRPCSSARIRSPVGKRKYPVVCLEALINGAWGAKRARSALGAGRSISNKRCVLEVYSRRQPYRGPKRARFELRSSGGETGLSLPPLPPDNRCVRLIHFRRLASWGAKRSRSALGVGRKASPSVRSLPRPNNSSSTCTRDWANLGEGPAGLIAELALASDVADYVRFRAVCKPWRQCSPDPCASGLDVRFLPRQWIMLDRAFAGSCRHRFLNVSTGECIRMGLPELLEGEHRFLEVTPEGLLLLFHKPTMIARLLNPLTRQLIDLPPLTAFMKGGHLCEPEEQGPFVKAVGLSEDSLVAVSFSRPMRLAFAKPGDDSWTVVNNGFINSALSIAGRFYCATNRGVMVLNTTSSDQLQQPPGLTMVADLDKSFQFFRMLHSLHLVDNGGELMLVHRTIGQDRCRKYNVYRVDLEAGILIPVKRLNGRAVFMGMLRAISVSVEAFPYVTADTIYLGSKCDKDTEEYNIADGSRFSRIYDGSVSPGTIVQSLINCIQDQDIDD